MKKATKPRKARKQVAAAKDSVRPRLVKGLTDKQALFVREYLKDFCAGQAAIRAGYSAKSADAIGCENLRKPEIQAAVAEAQKKLEARLDITLDLIARELFKLGFANMADYMVAGPDGDPYLDFSKLTREQAAALSEVTVEDYKDGRGKGARDVRKVRFKLADKRASLVDLARLLGYLKDKVEHSGEVSVKAKREDFEERVRRMSDEDLESYNRLASEMRALLHRHAPAAPEGGS